MHTTTKNTIPKNPINIELQVLEPQNISIKIFNILGKLVWSTERKVSEPGLFIAKWSGENQNKKEDSFVFSKEERWSE